MPLPAMRLFTPNGLPSTEIEIDNDALAPIGIKRGSTIDYIPFDPRYSNFFYHIKIKDFEDKDFLVDKTFIVYNRAKYQGKIYELDEIRILAVIVEKPNLRLVK